MNCPKCGGRLVCYLLSPPELWRGDRELTCRKCGWIGWFNTFRTEEGLHFYHNQLVGGEAAIVRLYREKVHERKKHT